MNVNFNNLRIQLANSYNGLCKVLNQSIKDKSFDPELVLSPDDIQKHMDNLRTRIVGICCCYKEGDENFKDVSEEIVEFESFNPEAETIS